MRATILNIGVSGLNSDYLNRKIRISNLVSVIVVIAMIAYLSANAFYFKVSGYITFSNLLLLMVAIATVFLQAIKWHLSAFHLLCSCLVLYFTFNPLLYGLSANVHFFQLVVCLIAIALFESKVSLRIYLLLATVSFFVILLFMHDRPGLIILSPEMEKNQSVVAISNLFLLFVIVAGFFSFFRRDNIMFQEAVLQQKTIIEAQRQKMIDSIAFAKDIQSGLFASDDLLKKSIGDRKVTDHFVLFKPKDIVSGDFYWAVSYHGNFYLAVCDSTGHGVPGAFMSLLNIGFLSEAIKEKDITKPNEIFDYVRNRLIETIGKDGQQDGMDAVLLCIHDHRSSVSPKKITYAAANNRPLLIRNNTPIELPIDKMPVGGGNKSDHFQLYTLEYKPGDVLYLFTDGYYDQFGGPRGKKLKFKHFINFLLESSSIPLYRQKYVLSDNFNNWRGNLEQVDDVLVVGMKL